MRILTYFLFVMLLGEVSFAVDPDLETLNKFNAKVPKKSVVDSEFAAKAREAEDKGITDASAISEPYKGKSLSCVQGSVNLCSKESLKLREPAKGEFLPEYDMGSKKKFIEWLKPAAQYLQSLTGIPASLIVAQALVESTHGTSRNFLKSNNLSGVSCSEPGKEINGAMVLNGVRHEWRAYCGRSRPPGEGGYYLNFRNREEMLLSYVTALLGSGVYPNVAAYAAKSHRQGTVADPMEIVDTPEFANYATDPEYQKTLRSTLKNEELGLKDLDDVKCAACLNRKSGGVDFGGGASDEGVETEE